MRDPDELDEAADELRDAIRTGDAVQVGGATYYREDEAEDVAPTVRQIREHLAEGGHIKRRSTPFSPWVSSEDHPQIADRRWETFPQDEVWHNYRLENDRG